MFYAGEGTTIDHQECCNQVRQTQWDDIITNCSGDEVTMLMTP